MSKPGLKHAVATSCIKDSPPLFFDVNGAEGRAGWIEELVSRSSLCGLLREVKPAVGGSGPGEAARSVFISGME